MFVHTSPEGSILDGESLYNSPSITGDPDLINAIKMCVEVNSGDEGSHGLLIRGGSADQNLILVDGISLYEFSHLGGISSIFLKNNTWRHPNTKKTVSSILVKKTLASLLSTVLLGIKFKITKPVIEWRDW